MAPKRQPITNNEPVTKIVVLNKNKTNRISPKASQPQTPTKTIQQKPSSRRKLQPKPTGKGRKLAFDDDDDDDDDEEETYKENIHQQKMQQIMKQIEELKLKLAHQTEDQRMEHERLMKNLLEALEAGKPLDNNAHNVIVVQHSPKLSKNRARSHRRRTRKYVYLSHDNIPLSLERTIENAIQCQPKTIL